MEEQMEGADEREPLVVDPRQPTSVKGICTAQFATGLLFSIVCTLASAAVVYTERGREGAVLFGASYLMELSLSMDNMFAFYLIFKYYACPEKAQSPCLFWGIAGAILLRAAILVLGATMVAAAKPLMLIFAALLVQSAWHTFTASDEDEDEDLSDNRVVRFLRWLKLPVTKEYHGSAFFAYEGGSLRATPLLLVLATIELSDIVFAADSVPAVLGLSNDTLVTYLAVMCAVLGLRTLYTLTVLLLKRFRFLQHAIALLLVFIGGKIVVDVLFGITCSPQFSLGIIIFTLMGGLVASMWIPNVKGQVP